MACVLEPFQRSCPAELGVVGRPLVWFQKQLSSAVNTARCGVDIRHGSCTLHGVLRSNTSPPHYRPGGSFCTAHTLAFFVFWGGFFTRFSNIKELCFTVSVLLSGELMESTSPINLLNPMTQRRIYANNPFKKNKIKFRFPHSCCSFIGERGLYFVTHCTLQAKRIFAKQTRVC